MTTIAMKYLFFTIVNICALCSSDGALADIAQNKATDQPDKISNSEILWPKKPSSRPAHGKAPRVKTKITSKSEKSYGSLTNKSDNVKIVKTAPEVGKVTEKDAGCWGAIKVYRAHLRAGPGKDHKILWTFVFPKNTPCVRWPVHILRRKAQWCWVVDVEGTSGWIMKALLTRDPFVYITASQALARRGPNETAPIVAHVQKGAVARCLEQKGSWVLVRLAKRLDGWMHQRDVWGVGDLGRQ